METDSALNCFAALSQATRLDTFRLLVRHQPDGLAAGEIARMLDVPANTMSTHLAILTRTGLIGSRRDGRSVIFHADLDRVRALMLFLIKDCCQGRAELCQPLADELLACRAF